MRKPLLKGGHYTPSAETNLSKTFAKWRRDYARDWDAAHIENRARTIQLWDEAHAENARFDAMRRNVTRFRNHG